MDLSVDDLKVDDLFEIQEQLWDARSKWRNIGLGLKISTSDIEVIDVNNGNVDDKFHSMILKWLQNGKNCTWGALCKVLSLRPVGHDKLAAEIKQKKCVDPSGPLPHGNVPPQAELLCNPEESKAAFSTELSLHNSIRLRGYQEELAAWSRSPGRELHICSSNRHG